MIYILYGNIFIIFIILDNFVYHVGLAIRESFYSPVIKGRLVIIALQRRFTTIDVIRRR